MALIVAAGAGERMGGEVPKQYRLLAGEAVLAHAVRVCKAHPAIREVRVVIHPAHRALYEAACGSMGLPEPIIGGETRQASVMNGLKALETDAPQWVLVHDAARPFLSEALISRVLDGLRRSPAVIPVIPVIDTLKEVIGQHVTGTPIRSTMRAVQTPQGFHYAALHKAHERFAGTGATDDAMVMEMAGQDVTVVEGELRNRKLTTPEDWVWAKAEKESAMVIATGQGFDVHKFMPHPDNTPESEKIVQLGGIAIPHTHRLEGHSDADAVLHALTDALLGAAGAGDIGQHFPPSEAKWKGADSEIFLKEALAKLTAEGGVVQHVDITILCEAPKIGPHREAMRSRIAEMLGLPEKRVNVKATTTETLGFTGRREGLAAMALATALFS